MNSPRVLFRIICSLAGLLLIGSPIDSMAMADDSLLFESDVQPILLRRCGKCHSKKVQKGSLDLSSMKSVRIGGESEEPLVAKSLDESYLWGMIDGGEMPPKGEPSLSVKEKDTIKRWLETGARSKTTPSATPKRITQHDVIPIVLLRCVTCHGARLKEGGVDLRTPQLMKKGGRSGPAFIAGKPESSMMIQRIESEACPPRARLLKSFVRRPAKAEVETIRQWIAAGAPEVNIRPDVATSAPDPLVTDEDRRHWAYQPLRNNYSIKSASIDGFVERRLEQAGLKPAPLADRDTLIRRAYIDLTGIPPTLDEWKRWRSAKRDDWYADMIDHLLASPHYGERWGRYWLDLAGYADSEGGVSADPLRKVAWKYRDYVIRSLNADKGYDRFLLEQIAGDELTDFTQVRITDEIVDNLIATGFLRMGIDQTGSRTMNFVPERLGVIADAISVLGSGVMGLTLECARCHSHKYDAIPQRDYYRFKSIFQGALDEHDWLTFKNRNLQVGTKSHARRIGMKNPSLQKELKKLTAKHKQAFIDLRLQLLRSHYPKQSEKDRQATLRALKVADNNRTQPQRILVEMLQTAEAVDDDEQPAAVQRAQQELASLALAIIRVSNKMEPPLTIRALWDRGEPSPTYILRRGEHDKPGRLVGPGVPSVLTNGRTPFRVQPRSSGSRATGRRLAFATWLTDKRHPLTARVMVNRIWFHHFGAGLVRSVENFGVKGERPTHPELLDWLAGQFMEKKWSIKEMHRLIMNSRTYRQVSRVDAQRAKADPENRLLSRMTMRRMDAEAIRDSLLLLAGQLDTRRGGPPDQIAVDREGQVTPIATESGKWRRSIYLQLRRTQIPTMLATFDYPVMGPNCVHRTVSVVSPQALMLMNDQHVRNLAQKLAVRIERATASVKSERRQSQIHLLYNLALSRAPSKQETAFGREALAALGRQLEDPQAALATYCHTLLNSAAFVYVD